MRLVFLLLLLLNIALWPLTAGLVHFGGGQTEPFRLTSQIEPERLRIVPEDDAARAPARAAEAVAAEDETDPQAPACRVLTGLSREQADALAARARDRQPPVQLSESEQPGSSSWWVHIPDLQTRPLAERKQAELKALGVREMALMPDADGQKFAISLGLFKT
ncbi:MAG: SPOR domain-containing protein, partial [Methyloversatilis sp.]|nr:SPOR domain-containing protein [Methyloversatilis sp.]